MYRAMTTCATLLAEGTTSMWSRSIIYKVSGFFLPIWYLHSIWVQMGHVCPMSPLQAQTAGLTEIPWRGQLSLLCCEQAASSLLWRAILHDILIAFPGKGKFHATLSICRGARTRESQGCKTKKIAWEEMCNCYFNKRSVRSSGLVSWYLCVLIWSCIGDLGETKSVLLLLAVMSWKVIRFLCWQPPFWTDDRFVDNLPALILQFQSGKQFWYKTEVSRHSLVSHICCPVSDRGNSHFLKNNLLYSLILLTAFPPSVKGPVKLLPLVVLTWILSHHHLKNRVKGLCKWSDLVWRSMRSYKSHICFFRSWWLTAS